MDSLFLKFLLDIANHPLARPQAYLDPGSGSVLLQLLLAAILGAGFVVKVYWNKIKTFFRRIFKKEEQTAEIEDLFEPAETKREDD
jgi:hypothetical protein